MSTSRVRLSERLSNCDRVCLCSQLLTSLTFNQLCGRSHHGYSSMCPNTLYYNQQSERRPRFPVDSITRLSVTPQSKSESRGRALMNDNHNNNRVQSGTFLSTHGKHVQARGRSRPGPTERHAPSNAMMK